MRIELPDNYAYFGLVALALNFHCMMTGFHMGGLGRKDCYQKDDFVERNFGEEHRKAFGPDSKPSKQGYPDTGNGLYSKKLTYFGWH